MATDRQDCQRQCSMATGHCTGGRPFGSFAPVICRGRSSFLFTLYSLKPTSGFEFHLTGRCELWSKPAWCSVPQQKQSLGNCAGFFGSMIFERYQGIRSLADFLYLMRSQVGASVVLSGYYCGALATALASGTMSSDRAPSLEPWHEDPRVVAWGDYARLQYQWLSTAPLLQATQIGSLCLRLSLVIPRLWNVDSTLGQITSVQEPVIWWMWWCDPHMRTMRTYSTALPFSSGRRMPGCDWWIDSWESCVMT